MGQLVRSAVNAHWDFVNAAFVHGEASVTAIGSVIANGSASITGEASVSAVGTVTVVGSATITGEGAVTASGLRIRSGTVSISGEASVSAVGALVISGQTTITGEASVTAIGNRVIEGSASITGEASMSAVGERVVSGTSSVSGELTVTATGIRVVSGSAAISAYSDGYTLEQLDQFGTLETLPASLDDPMWAPGGAQVTAIGTRVIEGSATVTGEAAVTATGTVEEAPLNLFKAETNQVLTSLQNTTVTLTWAAATKKDSSFTHTDGTSDVTIVDAGWYWINCKVQTANANRTELIVQMYTDTGGGFSAVANEIISNYASRDTDQDTGGTMFSTLYEFSANDELQFRATGDNDGTCTIAAGTQINIMKVA